MDAAVAADHAVAGDDLLLHAEVAAPVGDELVDFLERAGIEKQIDSLPRRELARLVLPPQPILAAAELRAALEILEMSEMLVRQAFTAWAFSQSLMNFSSPMSVSGCLNIASITAAGQVQTSAPSCAASTMWIGWRTDATSTSVAKS